MGIESLIKRLLGNWIGQNTVYSLSDNYVNTSINKTCWFISKNKQKLIGSIIQNIDKQYDQSFLVEINSNHIKNIKYLLFLCKKESKKGIILRLNDTFNFLSSSYFHAKSSDILYLDYNINNRKIIEKLYFINDNLKFIKSIVKQNNKYTTIFFSSEIKIK